MAKLIYKKNGREVRVGDELTSFRGEKYFATYFREPDHGEGKICVAKTKTPAPGDSREFYVSVFGLEWVV